MKALNGLLIIAIVILLSSCNPKVSTSISKNYSTLDYKQDVVVIGLKQSEPDNTEVIGQVRISDTGFTTRCSFEIVMDKAKLEARKVGGNAIKITKHYPPTIFWSSCHRITAKILKVEDIEAYKSKGVDSTLLDADHAVKTRESNTRESNKRDLLIFKDGREFECVINDEDDENFYISIFRDGNKIDTRVNKDQVKIIERAD